MTPILGIMASSMQGAVGNYESIQTYAITSATASVTFSSISATYKHLQIRFIGQTTSATVDTSMAVQLNGDTGSNYAGHRIFGDGTNVAVATATSTSFMRTDRLNAPTTTDSIFGAGVIDFLDYANTNKYKTIRSLGGVDRNGSGSIFFNSGLWMNTAAITSITLFAADTGNFRQYSHLALYGIK